MEYVSRNDEPCKISTVTLLNITLLLSAKHQPLFHTSLYKFKSFRYIFFLQFVIVILQEKKNFAGRVSLRKLALSIFTEDREDAGTMILSTENPLRTGINEQL